MVPYTLLHTILCFALPFRGPGKLPLRAGGSYSSLASELQPAAHYSSRTNFEIKCEEKKQRKVQVINEMVVLRPNELQALKYVCTCVHVRKLAASIVCQLQNGLVTQLVVVYGTILYYILHNPPHQQIQQDLRSIK